MLQAFQSLDQAPVIDVSCFNQLQTLADLQQIDVSKLSGKYDIWGRQRYDTNFKLLILLVDISGLISSIVDINEPFVTWTISALLAQL